MKDKLQMNDLKDIYIHNINNQFMLNSIDVNINIT